MSVEHETLVGVVLRAITDNAPSRAVQAAGLRVVEVLAKLCKSGLADDVRHLRENLITRDNVLALKERAEAAIKIAQAVEAANHAAESRRRAVAEARKLEAEADLAERAVAAVDEARVQEATVALENAIRHLRLQGGAVFVNPTAALTEAGDVETESAKE